MSKSFELCREVKALLDKAKVMIAHVIANFA